QAVIVVLAGLEIDANRNTLYDLDVVSGGVFGRQQAELGTAGAADTFHFAAVFAAVGVHAELDQLSRLHAAELRLFEVGCHPDVIDRHHSQQLPAGRDVLPDLHGLFADNPANGSDDGAITQVELRLIE